MYFNTAFVGCHHSFHVAQTQAKAFHVVQIASMHPVEFIEDHLPGFLAHAHAFVADRHLYTIAEFAGRNGDLRRFRRIFIGIIQQVVDDIGYMRQITFN